MKSQKDDAAKESREKTLTLDDILPKTGIVNIHDLVCKAVKDIASTRAR